MFVDTAEEHDDEAMMDIQNPSRVGGIDVKENPNEDDADAANKTLQSSFEVFPSEDFLASEEGFDVVSKNHRPLDDEDLEVGSLSSKEDPKCETAETATSETMHSSSEELDSDDISSELSEPPSDGTTKRYPAAFYCHLSGKLMKDPVVVPDGESCERQVYMEQRCRLQEEVEVDDEIEVYPNRALKMIMDDSILVEPNDISFQASLKRWQNMAIKMMDTYFADSTTATPTTTTKTKRSDSDDGITDDDDESELLSDGFYCPITFAVFHDPVIDRDGNTFEKVAVENWIRLHGTSPVTRNALSVDELYPNHAIQRLLQAELQKPDDQLHPEIRKWKSEPTPKSSDLEYGGGIQAAQESSNSDTRATTAMSREQERSLADLEHRRYRRRIARRQMFYNLAGLIVCILLLRFVHSPKSSA